MKPSRRPIVAAALFLNVLGVASATAQAPLRKIGEMEVALVGIRAAVDPINPVVPKNTPSGVRIVVKAGEQPLSASDLAAFLGTGFRVEALLSGPGLPTAVDLPHLGPGETLPADPLLLPLPALAQGGDYQLTNVRIVAGGATALDVEPQAVTVKVIDQILITSVKTRALTLDEIKQRGIVLDSDDYLGFEFTLGLKLESRPVNITFPVVFDRQGVPVPQPILPPPVPSRTADPLPPLPTIVPMLLEVFVPDGSGGGQKVPLTLPNGTPIRIPSLLVIPGNVGFLKQFFSAQLFVANGAPAGSNLVVRNVTGTIKLPLGRDGREGPDPNTGINDDPLALPELLRDGNTIVQPRTMGVLGVGPDGVAATADDVEAFDPGEQGQAEFLVRGEKEGYHNLDFDIAATLDGLPVGPVQVSGKASGGVLVRNPNFNMTFTVPNVVRRNEEFSLFVTVSNVGQSAANLLNVALDGAAFSGFEMGTLDPSTVPPTPETGERTIPTLAPGDAKTLTFRFRSKVTGKVVASYARTDLTEGTHATTSLKFTLGVGERGVALSPDTLVLPSAVDQLPTSVVEAAMRVLGQAWSLANSPPGTMPRGVIRTDRSVVTQKAIALAEAGLRYQLGEPLLDSMRDLAFDFYGGQAIDPGFDQLLRQTDAGREFASAVGAALGPAASAAGGALAYEALTASSGSLGGDVLSFAVTGAPGLALSITDSAGRRTSTSGIPVPADVPGGVVLPLGAAAAGARLGAVTSPTASPYVLELTATQPASTGTSVSFPRGDGTLARVEIGALSLAAGGRARLTIDLANPSSVALDLDEDGDGTFATQSLVTETVTRPGPEVISASLIGPETLDTASPFGLQAVLLLDRPVDPASAAALQNYTLRANQILAAKAQLSGRLVFLSLAQPEGPYVAGSIIVSGLADRAGRFGGTETKALTVRLEDPGAVVSGRVLNAEGTPVTNGSVTYINQVGPCDNPGHGPLAAVRLGGDGRYEFRYVRQDPCGSPFKILTVDPVTGALRQLVSSVRARGEQIVLDVLLFGRGSVSGTVRQGGVAVTGAQVVAFSGTDSQIGGNATTDGDGHYTIAGITVGPVNVRAAKGTGAGQSSGRIDRAGTTATVDVNLDGGAIRLVGTVSKLEDGETTPLAGLYVYYYLAGGGNALSAAVTDSAGRFAFEGLPAGPYALQASLNARDHASVSGIATVDPTLPPGVLTTITQPILISIAPPQTFGTLTGTVRLPGDGGGPAADVIVSVVDRGVLTDSAGAFTIPGIPVAPNQTVSARSRDGLRSGSASFSVFAANQPVTTTITLSGLGSAQFTVLDPAGQKIVGIPVRHFGASCADPCGCVVGSTNSEGIIRFDDIPLGSVFVQVIRSSGGATDVAGGTASVTRDGMTGFGIVRFAGAGTVTGHVEEAVGNAPAFGSDVTLTSRFFYNDGLNTCGLVPGVSHRARTDLDGNFRFTGVNVGPVGVTAVGGVANPTPVGKQDTLTADGQQVAFSLKLVNTIAGELRGTVFLPDGVTPAGSLVDVTANGPLPELAVKTNAEGVYRFPKILPEGTYTIVASDPVTGGISREQIYVRTGQDSVHDQRLKGKGTIKVRVLNANDEPVTNAFVRLRESDFPGRSFEAAIQPANEGVVTFDGMFEGPFNVEVSDPLGRGGRASSVLPHPGDTVEIKVRLTITGNVEGRFRMPNGTPIPLGSVSLSVNGRAIGQATTRGTDPVGSFKFAFVPAGDIRIDAQDPITARTGVAFGRLTQEGETATIDVVAEGLGTVAGTVLSNGAPQPLAHVDIVSGTFRTATTTDDAGHYLVRGIPTGRVNVTANLGNGFLSGSATDTLLADGDTVTIDVNLRGSGALTGHVVSANGTPAPVSIVTVQIGGTGGGTFSTITDGGSFGFTRLPAGAARLTVEVVGSIDRGTATAEVPVADTADVTVPLNGIGSIEGHALDSNQQPVAGDLTLVGTGPFGYQHFVRVGTDGYFRFPELLAGPFTASLSARVADFTLYGTRSDTLGAGDAKQIDVQVQDSGTVTGRVRRAGGVGPAFGSQVTLNLDPFRGALGFQAQDDGGFVFRGVPLGPFSVRVSDPVSGGVALVIGRNLAQNGQTVDLGAIVLDDGAVAVTSVDPPDGALGVSVTRAIVATFSDPLAGTGGVSIRTAAGPSVGFLASLSPDRLALTLTPSSTWPDAQEIQVTFMTGVVDIYGRPLAQALTTRLRTVDLSPPAVATIVPANGAIQVGPASTVKVTFNEELDPAHSPAGLVRLTGPAGEVTGEVALTAPAEVVFTPAAPLVGNANYGVTVNGALDRSGNTQTQAFSSVFKTLDSVPPVLSLATPANGSWIKTARPAIQIFFSDALSGPDVATKTLQLDSVSVSTGGSGNTIDYTPPAALADGPHTVSASVADRAGNTGTLDANFNVDTQAPSAAALAGLTDGEVVRGTITLSATATDVPSGIARFEFFDAGNWIATALAPAISVSYNTAALSEGQHLLTTRAADVAGNVGPIGPGLPVIVDNHQMTLVIAKPTGVNPRFREEVVVQAIASEPVQSIDFTVGPPGSPVVTDSTSPYEVTLSIASVPEGPNTVRATAHGLVAGDTQFAEKAIVVDRTPPAAPDPTRITAEESDAGLAQVAGGVASVEGLATVEVENTSTQGKATTIAAQDGSWALFLLAAVDTHLSVVAADSAGNRSAPTLVTVTRPSNLGGIPLAGLSLWASADVEGITVDASAGVSAWPDKSDDHNDLVQVAGASRPKLVLDGFNGRPVLRFDGNDFIQFSTRLTKVRTVFWVVKEDAAASFEYRPLLGDATTADFWGGPGIPGALWRGNCCDAFANVVGGQTFVNGVLVNGETTPRPRTLSVISLITTGDTRAGNFGRQNDGRSWFGDLAELLVYDRPLTSGERQAVEDYLVAKYRMYTPTASTPSIVPAGGVFTDSTTVRLATTTPDARIRYTLDGSEPTEASPEYEGSVVVAATTTVKARAFRSGFIDSRTATATFMADTEAPPAAGMKLWLRADAGVATNAGSWTSEWLDQSGSGNHATQTSGLQLPQLIPNAMNGLPVMRFDGNDFMRFTTQIPNVRTVFWVVKESEVATFEYRPLLGDDATADFWGGPGVPGALWRGNCCDRFASVVNGQTLLNGVPVSGESTARPRTMSLISLITTGDVRAGNFGRQNDGRSWWGDLAELVIYDRALTADERREVEDYLTAKYQIGDVVLPPTISPPGGRFTDSVSVTVATRTPRADVFYTTDGTEPTPSSIPYTGPIVLTATTTVKAKAFREGLTESATVTAGFTRATDFSPRSISGLGLWLRADAGAPTRLGDFWADQSGSGNHAYQPHSGSTPHIVPNAVNGLPVMRFDGNDFVRFTTRLTHVRTVFWVLKESEFATFEYRPLLGDDTTADFWGGPGVPGALWRGNCCDAFASVVNGQTLLNGVPVSGEATARPRSMSLISLVTTGDVRAGNFGRQNDGRSWWGDLAELVIYDRALTADERRDVEEYLTAKYELGGAAIAPVISPMGGAFSGAVTVSVSVATPGAAITYTTNGTEPTPSSTSYTGPITLTASTTLKAKAFRDGLAGSATATAAFTRDGDFSPRALAGLQLWLRADAGVRTGLGDFWADQSGNGNDGFQAHSGSTARVVPDASNGLPVMRFDGNDFVRFTSRLTNVRTVFWVVKEDAAASFDYRPLLGDDVTADFWGGPGSPGPLWRGNCCDAFANVVTGQTYLNGAFVDGTVTARPRTMSVISLVTAGDVRAGNFGRQNDGRSWWGDLAELVIYDRALPTDQRQAVEDYLRIRYWDVTTVAGANNVSVSWLRRPSAVKYDVERSTTSGSGYVVVASNLGQAVTSYGDLTVAPQTTYYYRVVAVDASGSRFPSREVAGRALAP